MFSHAVRRLLRAAKTTVLRSARAAGVFELVRDSGWRTRRLLILAYHGVSLDDEHKWRPDLYMSPATFESRLKMLAAGGYSVLSLADALTALQAERLPPRSVSLTFDDGNHDFYRRVFPALSAYGFPATVYLTTYYCEYNRPIFRLVCSYMLWKQQSHGVLNSRHLTGEDRAFDLSSATGREALVRALVVFSRTEQLSGRDKNNLAERLSKQIRFDYDALCERRILHLMNSEEVTQLARRSVDFQMHTHRHNCPHNAEGFVQEIRDNRRHIERLTNSNASHFCYPCGRYKSYFLPWLEMEQVDSATTCDPGFATAHTSRLLLPRFIDTQDVPPVRFEGWLTGIAAWLPGRRTAAEMQS